jgi:hypothetical protein
MEYGFHRILCIPYSKFHIPTSCTTIDKSVKTVQYPNLASRSFFFTNNRQKGGHMGYIRRIERVCAHHVSSTEWYTCRKHLNGYRFVAMLRKRHCRDCGHVSFELKDVRAFNLAVALQIVDELNLRTGPAHRLCRMALGYSQMKIAEIYSLPPSGGRFINKMESRRKRVSEAYWLTLARHIRRACESIGPLPRVTRLILVK